MPVTEFSDTGYLTTRKVTEVILLQFWDSKEESCIVQRYYVEEIFTVLGAGLRGAVRSAQGIQLRCATEIHIVK